MDHADYAAAVAELRRQLLGYSAEVWAEVELGDAGLERLVELLVPTVLAAQTQMGNFTSIYFGESTGTQPLLVGDAINQGRGVDPETVYARPVITARTALSQGKSPQQALAIGGKRLQNIAGTDLQMAKVRQSQRSLAAGGKQYYRRVLTGSENCAMCTIASTQRYKTNRLMPIHPGCVPGDALLSIAGGSSELANFAWGQVEAVSRRMFKGELIEFVTSAGDQVRVTPNHPVLTNKGWLPAHLLGEGDTVFRSAGRERVVHGGPHVNERPSLAEDVFDAARMAFPLVRMPLATEDFHADGAQGEVEIVRTDGNFPPVQGSEFGEVLSECLLVGAHGGRLDLDSSGTLYPFRQSGFAATGGPIGGGSLGGALFWGHPGSAVLPGGGAVARFDAPAQEFRPENAAVYARQGLNLKRRLAGQVEADCIVELRRVSFSGHVYNLHTREGWYQSNNHTVSNCDCHVDVLRRGMDLNQVVDPQLLEQTHQQVKAIRGIDDRNGRMPDYRKLIVTREHGEVGPVLTWAHQQFTAKADL